MCCRPHNEKVRGYIRVAPHHYRTSHRFKYPLVETRLDTVGRNRYSCALSTNRRRLRSPLAGQPEALRRPLPPHTSPEAQAEAQRSSQQVHDAAQREPRQVLVQVRQGIRPHGAPPVAVRGAPGAQPHHHDAVQDHPQDQGERPGAYPGHGPAGGHRQVGRQGQRRGAPHALELGEQQHS
ncbi:unnamed protein product [Phytophthora lilii]|uniref:Unnamed protein product n=1 Tax=Phytophthora lilii TaxID=2077276 RepID=A0A9W6U8X6_9STRA|nr:unnamed protein product [Phytophthora lilii]